jgi:S-formylglutathione hydrolase FrmB
VWYLSALICNQANVTENGEFRRACAELSVIFVAPDNSPRGRGVPGDPEARADAGIPLQLRHQPGYDHSYYLVSTFMEEHLRWHADRL